MIRSWRHPCPDCGTEMTATGKVSEASAGFWHVEFWCVVDAEKFRIATSEWNRLLSPAPAPVIVEQ